MFFLVLFVVKPESILIWDANQYHGTVAVPYLKICAFKFNISGSVHNFYPLHSIKHRHSNFCRWRDGLKEWGRAQVSALINLCFIFYSLRTTGEVT